MNEMEMLTQLRDEVPLGRPTPGAERLFRAGLADIQDGSPARGPWPGRSWLPRSRGARVATALVLAGAVAAGVLAAVLPGDGQSGAGEAGSQAPGPTLSVQLLADRAASAALAQPSVPPGQWVYRKVELGTDSPYQVPSPYFKTSNMWSTADGRRLATGPHCCALSDRGPGPSPNYSQLSSLPADPAALDTYLAHLHYPNPAEANKDVADFVEIQRLLTAYVVPPGLAAELYHALADIPTVAVRENVTDIAGQTGVAFIQPEPGGGREIILSTTDYRLLATADTGNRQWLNHNWFGPGSDFTEWAYLSQAFVSGPGVLP